MTPDMIRNTSSLIHRLPITSSYLIHTEIPHMHILLRLDKMCQPCGIHSATAPSEPPCSSTSNRDRTCAGVAVATQQETTKNEYTVCPSLSGHRVDMTTVTDYCTRHLLYCR